MAKTSGSDKPTTKDRAKSVSKTTVWGIIGLAVIGFGGFGASGLSGTIRTIGTVGDKHIDVDQYARALSQQIQTTQQETGQAMPFAQVQAIGLDRAVLQQLVETRALDHEATQLGLSIGDQALRDQIVSMSAFQGLDGTFDREGYAFALQNSGQSEAEFEATLREEAARTLLQGAIVSGVVMPDTFSTTLINYIGETRDFTWARLAASDLDAPLTEPTDEILRAYYDENLDQFQLAPTKRLTYVLLTPDMLIGEIDIAEEELRTEFEARSEQFNRAERRLVERLVFLDQESADQAAAALEVNGTTFDALVAERGLALADVDLGDVGRLELDAAGEAVFSAQPGDVVGPLPSSLGPALFRMNGILPAQNTSFEDAIPTLRETLAADRSRRLVATQAQEFDDLLAGGATLEELDAETDMQLGKIDWFDGTGEGVAAYLDFTRAAAAVTAEDFPEIGTLDDGGIFALRLDDELPARDMPFDDARDQVLAAWQNNRLETRLTAQAEALLPQLKEGGDFAGLGLSATIETEQTRSAFVGGTPPSLMSDVFDMSPGEFSIIDSFGTVLIVRLDQINPASDNAQAETLTEQMTAQTSQSLARDLYNIYARDTVLRAGQNIDQRALQAVHINFP